MNKKINPTVGNDSAVAKMLKEQVKHWEEEIRRQLDQMCSETTKENDMVNNPVHYQSMVKDLNIDAITCMRAAYGDEDVKAFCLCNAFKYLFRCYSKGGNEDIQKAIWNLNKYLELDK